jgi:SAM-dependent methyltransferase
MAKAFPASRFVGLDIVEAALALGRSEASSQGLTNATFVKRDAAKLDGSEHFDFITTFDSVHDQARPDLVLSGIAHSLRPGGVYLCVDMTGSSVLADNMDLVMAPFHYGFSCLYCVTISLAGGGMGLGSMWGEQLAVQMLSEAGFTSVHVAHRDDWNNFYLASKD